MNLPSVVTVLLSKSSIDVPRHGVLTRRVCRIKYLLSGLFPCFSCYERKCLQQSLVQTHDESANHTPRTLSYPESSRLVLSSCIIQWYEIVVPSKALAFRAETLRRGHPCPFSNFQSCHLRSYSNILAFVILRHLRTFRCFCSSHHFLDALWAFQFIL